jgi:glycosyltransferase 2 family protein
VTTPAKARRLRVRRTTHRLWIEFRGHWIILIGVAAVVALVIAVHPASVARALSNAVPVMLVLMLPVVLLLYFLRGVTWSVVLRGARQPVGVRQAIRITFISQTFVFLPGGDLWRVPIVKSDDREALDAGVLTATVVLDDLVYLFVLTFAMVPVVAGTPVLVISLAVALLPQLAIFGILLSPTVYNWLAGRVANIRLFRRFRPQLDLLGPSFRSLVHARTLLPIICLDIVAASLSVALFALALGAVHATGTDLPHVAFTYSASQVVTNLTVIPGALGAYEGMMTGAMALQGVAPAAAASGALLYRVVNDLLMALLGLAIAFLSDRDSFAALRRAPRPTAP